MIMVMSPHVMAPGRMRYMIMVMSPHVIPRQNEVHDNGDVTTCDPPSRMRCMIMVMSLHVMPLAE